MGYIVLSKQQVEGGLNVKLCKDKASADSYRKQLIKQYYDVVILDKSDYDLLAKNLFKDWVYGGEDNKLDGHEVKSYLDIISCYNKLNDHDRHLRDTNKREII